VVVLEASRDYRSCPGETLHPGVEPLFKQLGILNSVLAERFHRHCGIWVEWDGARHFQSYGKDETGPWFGFQAERRRLHSTMLKAASDAGAIVVRPVISDRLLRHGARVTGVRAGDRDYLARWTLDATGRSAWMAKALELRQVRCSPRLYARFFWKTTDFEHSGSEPAFAASAQGWIWEAPLGNRTARVELRMVEPDCPLRGSAGIDLTWRIQPACAGPGYFMLGDAAATLDPASSHGVLRALMSGMFSAHLTTACVNGILPEAAAADAYRNWISGQFSADTTALRILYARHPVQKIARAFAGYQTD
jgi:flavin-dependent dehydrogenase